MQSHPPAIDLLVLTREHDLPPKWDGHQVDWCSWEHSAATLICPPPASRQRCGQCRSTTPPLISAGTVHPVPGQTYQVDRTKRTKSGREYVSGTVTVLAHPVLRLHVFRCPDCHQDTVWDEQKDQWWDLDHTDYGTDGSTSPVTEEDTTLPLGSGI